MTLFFLVAAALMNAPATTRGEADKAGISAPADANEIVVEGSRNRDKQIRDFVGALTPAPKGGLISRFDEKVCPVAVGLPELQGRAVAARLRKVAAAAGIKVAGEDCAPNALVVVVGAKKEFLTALRAKFPSYFQTALGDPIRTPREPGPATAWHVESILDADGIKPTLMRNPETGAKYFVVESMESGRVKPMSRPHFVAGVLVVELSSLAGLTTTQLADYAAMRLYGRTEPARLAKSSTPTILTILDAPMNSPVPMTLTEWDLAFLKSLYATEPLQFATQQRGAMVRQVGRELGRGTAPK